MSTTYGKITHPTDYSSRVHCISPPHEGGQETIVKLRAHHHLLSQAPPQQTETLRERQGAAASPRPPRCGQRRRTPPLARLARLAQLGPAVNPRSLSGVAGARATALDSQKQHQPPYRDQTGVLFSAEESFAKGKDHAVLEAGAQAQQGRHGEKEALGHRGRQDRNVAEDISHGLGFVEEEVRAALGKQAEELDVPHHPV